MDIKDTSSLKSEQKSDKDLVLYKSLAGSLFSGSRKLYFVYAKAEKLAGAIFLVTELVPESNPIKQRLRSASLSALSHALDFVLAIRSRVGTDEGRQEALAIVQEIVSLCRVALANPGASRMNFSLLEKEYENLLRDILSLSPEEASEKILSPELLSVAPEVAIESPTTSFYIPPMRALKPDQPPRQGASVRKGSSVRLGDMSYKTPGNVLEKPLKPKGHFEKQNREIAVLKIVGERGPLGIKEIAHAIPDCSEKTIQRLLADLVSQGVLKKEGERRWSIYSLAQKS